MMSSRTCWLWLALAAACGRPGSSRADGGAGGGSTTGGSSNVVASANEGQVFFSHVAGASETTGIEVCFNEGSLGLYKTGSVCDHGAPCCFAPEGGGFCQSAVSAGTLTFTDGAAVLGTLPYLGDDYGTLALGQSAWAVGDQLSVSASGAAIGPFSGAFTVPPSIALTTPTTSGSLSVTRDLVVSWVPDSTVPDEFFEVSVFVPGVGAVACYPTDASGTVTLPGSLLQNLPSGSAATLRVIRTAQTVVMAPSAAVDLLYQTEQTVALTTTP